MTVSDMTTSKTSKPCGGAVSWPGPMAQAPPNQSECTKSIGVSPSIATLQCQNWIEAYYDFPTLVPHYRGWSGKHYRFDNKIVYTIGCT